MSFQEKKIIRTEILSKRDQIGGLRRKRVEHQLFRRAAGSEKFRHADVILLFAGHGSEISTGKLVKYALRCGKRVYLPKVISPSDSHMEFYRIHTLQELHRGYRGILEPSTDEMYEDTDVSEDTVIMFVPGVAFDRKGYRIGYGKGFYDRYLSRHPYLQGKTLGLAYQCQMMEHVPADDTDIPVKELWVF